MTHNPSIPDDSVKEKPADTRPPKPIALPVIPENIPRELKARAQWVVWRYEWNGKKWDKPPRQAATDALASSTDASTWSTFAAALATVQSGNYDGLGYVFSANDPYTGIDLDHCLDPDSGNIDPDAYAIVQRLNSYTEYSVSGGGLHTIGCAKLPGLGHKKPWIEIYDCGRYFTVTGQHIKDTPLTLTDAQEAVSALYHEIWGTTPTKRPTKVSTPASNGQQFSPPLTDEQLLTLANRATNGAKFAQLWSGNTSAYAFDNPDGSRNEGRSEADQALCGCLGFYTQDEDQIDRLLRQSGLMREKWANRGDYRNSTIRQGIDVHLEYWTGVNPSQNGRQPHISDEAEPPYHTSEAGDHQPPQQPVKPTIQLSTDMTVVVNRMQAAIRLHPNGPFLYQRAHQLSMIIQGAKPPRWLDRGSDAPLIHPADKARIRELAALSARWIKWDARKKAEVEVMPPPWAIETLMARPRWTFPPLEGIICAPTLRPDGSILDQPGYDRDTGLYLSMDPGQFPPIPEHPTIDDTRRCVRLLQEPFTDFPFAAPHHQSAALAAVLSLVGRFTIQGKVPFFAVRSTTRGAGKGLLIDGACVIATGRHAPRWAQTLDEEEERKRLMTIAMSGDAALHIDNIGHPLGSGPLDMVMTAEAITERVMASHAERTAPIKAVFFGSGNNMVFQSDMARRVVPIDLAPEQERPDERENFAHHPLLGWILEQRPKLVMAALTILKAYIDAGRPKQDGLKAFGSYEQWSDLIRQSLVWAGEPDPCAGRGDIEAESDPKYEAQNIVLRAWYERYGEEAKTIKDVIDDIDNHTAREFDDHDKPTGKWVTDPGWRDLQTALITIDRRGKFLDIRAIQYAFRSWAGRVLGHLQLQKMGQDRLGATQWRVKKMTS